jgi:hypothetical protein
MTLGTNELRFYGGCGFAANQGFSHGIARAFISPSSQSSYNRYRHFLDMPGRRTIRAVVA